MPPPPSPQQAQHSAAATRIVTSGSWCRMSLVICMLVYKSGLRGSKCRHRLHLPADSYGKDTAAVEHPKDMDII